MTRIAVPVPSGTYDVTVAAGALREVGPILAGVLDSRRAAIITDETVRDVCGADVQASLAGVGFETVTLTVPPGEGSKSWHVAGELLERLAAAGIERRDAVVALGGGVIGDLAGFCSGVYLRGVGFVQVPTTLLAQVDSSIGGKTGVDLQAGKNLAGVFVQPQAVVADTSVLASLPDHEWRSGLAEVVKSAVLDGEGFLGWLETHADDVNARDPDVVEEAVVACIRFKAGVVAADEREAGVRESLNLGHTLGHAVEKAAGFGAAPHGLAVAAGMRFAARLAVRLEVAPVAFAARQERLLDLFGLMLDAGGLDADAVRYAMRSDKKVRGGDIRFVLATAPGTHMVTAVDDRVIAEELESFLKT